jgi:hypothetical protein
MIVSMGACLSTMRANSWCVLCWFYSDYTNMDAANCHLHGFNLQDEESFIDDGGISNE